VSEPPPPLVQIRELSKHFDGVVAVDRVSLDILRSELFAILGSSGCGKTTLLRMLAGFEQPTSGQILIDGVDVTDAPPYERPVNMMFQSYALFPHMTVAQNVAYGLKKERVPPAQIKERVAEMLTLVKLEPLADRKPDKLSGGQRSAWRSLELWSSGPNCCFSMNRWRRSTKLREHTQFELANLQYQLGTTFVVVA
jgi:putrescine transport system ATP-binding protein